MPGDARLEIRLVGKPFVPEKKEKTSKNTAQGLHILELFETNNSLEVAQGKPLDFVKKEIPL